MASTGESTNFTQAGFHTTQWNLVLASAQDGEVAGADDALDDLCRQLLVAALRVCAAPREIAARCAGRGAGFLSAFHRNARVRTADPQRGRFRAFLLGSFIRFMASEWERGHTQKRGGNREIVSLDMKLIEASGLPELTTAATPERAFEERWR